MFNSKFYGKVSNSANLLIDRQYGNIDGIIRQRFQNASQFIDRLELEVQLEGHHGCVNCLEWSTDGKILASGSDDFHVMLWDPFRKKRTLSLKTPHTGNMFSVKFLPKSDNSRVVTGAADKCIFVFDVHRQNEPIWECTSCHWARVKRLATAPDMPFTFWSAGEDGSVMQFDIREPHSRTEDKVLLLNLFNNLPTHAEVKCVAVNPRRTEYIAVGTNDPYARVFDRRMLTLESAGKKLADIRGGDHRSTQSEQPKGCVTYFCPGHINKDNAKYVEGDSKTITYLTFNPEGTELLVNMGGEHIYLYNLNKAEVPVYLDLPPHVRNPDDTEVSEPVKRKIPERVESFKKMGNEFLENEKYLRAIVQYSDAIKLAPDCPVFYLNRATAYMRRLWYGDVYAALRDCHAALRIDPSYIKAHFRLARALLDLGRPKEADQCLKELINRFPTYQNNHGVMMLKKDIAEYKKETVEGSLMLDYTDEEWELRGKAKDYETRYIGHCNTTTDIKEANFFGADGKFIVAGSDDGNFFIWERDTCKIRSVYKADMAIVNCVQPHPQICMMATSGIDHDIKIWSPMADVSENKSNRVSYIDGIVESNQHKMKSDPFEINTPNAYCRSS